MKQMDFAGSMQEFNAKLRSDKANFFSDPKGILSLVV